MATARMIQERTERWVELHGQHEDQLLVRPSAQRSLLDAFAGSSELAERVAGLADALTALEREAEELARAEAARSSRSEYLRAQVEEIEKAALRPGEEEGLEAEARLLAHGEERMKLAGEVYEALEGADRSLTSVLASLQRRLDRLAELDPATAELAERLSSARYEIGDMARELTGYAESVDHDPAHLAATEERRELLFRLKRKHGAGTVEELVERGAAMAAELAQPRPLDRAGSRARGGARGASRRVRRGRRELADARGGRRPARGGRSRTPVRPRHGRGTPDRKPRPVA